MTTSSALVLKQQPQQAPARYSKQKHSVTLKITESSSRDPQRPQCTLVRVNFDRPEEIHLKRRIMLPVPAPGLAGANQANANQNGAQPALNNGQGVNGNQQAPLGPPGFGANAQGFGLQPFPPTMASAQTRKDSAFSHSPLTCNCTTSSHQSPGPRISSTSPWKAKSSPRSTSLADIGNSTSLNLPAFTTAFGVFEWNRVPMGIHKAGPFFQHVVQNIILKDKMFHQVAVYINDVLVVSK